jgi:hypothetical protein
LPQHLRRPITIITATVTTIITTVIAGGIIIIAIVVGGIETTDSRNCQKAAAHCGLLHFQRA